MRRNLSPGILAALVAVAGAPPQEATPVPAPFEGARVLELPGPAAEGGVRVGDVILALDGQAPASLPALRRRVGESLGARAKVRLRREGRELEVEWTPLPGPCRLTDWPSPVEFFRRSHAKAPDAAGVQAGLQGLQAAEEGKARTALRQLERAGEAGLKDPVLDWAQACVLVRFQNLPADAEAPFNRALKAVANPVDAGARRLRGWCHVVAAYKNLLHARKPPEALREYAAARSWGVDTTELARALASSLPPDSKEAWDLRVQAFDDDPLDRSLAEFLAGRAPNDAANARYTEWVRRLSGTAVPDPRVELTALITRLNLDPDARPALEAFLAGAKDLNPEDRARGLDALAAWCDRASQAAHGFELREEALKTAPTARRARSLARSARAVGRWAPALHRLRGFYDSKADGTNERLMSEYMTVYAALLADAQRSVGVRLVEEAVRLSRLGRTTEAAEFLAEQAEVEAQPDLRVTAGLLLREAGEDPDPDVYFKAEAEFWDRMARLWWVASGPVGPGAFRSSLLRVRIGTEGGGMDWILEEGSDRSAGLRSPAATNALRAAAAWRTQEPAKAVAQLRQAAEGLGRVGSNRGWIPVYAEGRLCRTVRDFVAALNERHKAGLVLPAAPEGPAYAVGPQGFIRHWLLLGPVPLGEKASQHNETSQKGLFDQEWFLGHWDARPREFDRVEVAGVDHDWQAEEPPSWGLDFGWAENTLMLGATYLVCEKDLPDLVLSIGSDDGSCWRLDGKELIRVYDGRGLKMDQNRSSPFMLKAGLHVLAFAVVNGTGPSGACARLLDREGRPVRDFAVTLTPDSRPSRK